MKNKLKNNTGFTLIEMTVAVGIFATVMTISLSALLSVNNIQRKAETLRSINDGLNFSIETMLREIRTGSSYVVGGGGNSLTFKTSGGKSVIYRLNNKAIERSEDGSPFLILTAPEIEITTLLFVARGQAVGDGLQPSVTIIMNGIAGTDFKSHLNLQTTVSQRELDS